MAGQHASAHLFPQSVQESTVMPLLLSSAFMQYRRFDFTLCVHVRLCVSFPSAQTGICNSPMAAVSQQQPWARHGVPSYMLQPPVAHCVPVAPGVLAGAGDTATCIQGGLVPGARCPGVTEGNLLAVQVSIVQDGGLRF